ncbi:WYL domain-containing protein [Herbaspirillum frisingense]|uniref:helix-turn-helix transcriptional regulator n=1 Tax=Herbaspirillum frisingense TaxID=92645 RepID=UPI0016004065|nr:WYL domain-containing protein [Herbaspirillum frisingense]QNB06821.1 WYL domain-containing protein [Herbaspirillum frisingense]
MSSIQLSEMTQSQRDRLAFVELRLRFLGEIRRQDLVGRFGIQAAAATRDLGQYRELGPRNLDYDTKGKLYVRGEWFRPVFEFPAERVLTWLSQGYGDGEPSRLRSLMACDGSALSTSLDLDMLSVLTRAIHKKTAVEISYRALSSGLATREIVPFALADNGQRWHVRGYDRRSGDFRDFVLTRIADARPLAGPVQEHETADQDIQWNRIAEIELVPHPANVQHPDTIEAEYGMGNGVLRMRVRAAMAGYLMRRWNVDCTEDHSLKGAEFHLWLRNRQALYGVTNLVLAPGYESQEKA